jgi:hypothetical protein
MRETMAKRRWDVTFFLLWVVAFHGLFQVVSILRPVGATGIGAAIQAINPLFLLAILFSGGDKRFLIPRDPMQFLLLLLVAVASVVGIGNLADGAAREYLSHLVNALTGYVMYSFARSLGFPVFTGTLYTWSIRILLACSAVSVAALHYLDALGYVARFAAEGYSLLLPLAHGAASSIVAAVLSIGLIGLSNKRGAYLMAAAVLAVEWLLHASRTKLTTRVATIGAVISLVLLVLATGVATPLIERASQHHFVERTLRLLSVTSVEELDTVSSGRIGEMRAAVTPLDPVDVMVGAGFGYTYDLVYSGGVERLHNSHFSPLTVSLRHGLPFSLFFFGFVAYWLLAAIAESRKARWDAARMVPVLYVAGAAVYSLTAFVIYVDLLFFFSIGHMIAITESSRQARNAARAEAEQPA